MRSSVFSRSIYRLFARTPVPNRNPLAALSARARAAPPLPLAPARSFARTNARAQLKNIASTMRSHSHSHSRSFARESRQEPELAPVGLGRANQRLLAFAIDPELVAKLPDDLRVQRDSLPADLVEALDANHVASDANDRCEEAVFVRVAAAHRRHGFGLGCARVRRRGL